MKFIVLYDGYPLNQQNFFKFAQINQIDFDDHIYMAKQAVEMFTKGIFLKQWVVFNHKDLYKYI